MFLKYVIVIKMFLAFRHTTMENTNKESEKLLQLEKYVRKSIEMTLQDVVPWSTLVILVNDT